MFNSLFSKYAVYFYSSKRLDVSNKDLSLSTIHTHSSTEYTAYNGYSLKVSSKQEYSSQGPFIFSINPVDKSNKHL